MPSSRTSPSTSTHRRALDDGPDHRDAGGQRVYGINAHAAGIELKTGAGRHEVEVCLPRLHFAEGDYVVRVGIAEVPAR